MYKVFKSLIHQGSALDYIDVILLMSNSKLRILQLFKQLHDFVERRKLDLALKKTFFLFLTVHHLGHEIGYKKRTNSIQNSSNPQIFFSN